MAKTATIRARIEPFLPPPFEFRFSQLGLSVTQANALLQRVALQRGLPFAVKVPNTETEQALQAGA